MEGPGFHPGIARKAEAGPMEAGSAAVATTSVTMAVRLPRCGRRGRRGSTRRRVEVETALAFAGGSDAFIRKWIRCACGLAEAYTQQPHQLGVVGRRQVRCYEKSKPPARNCGRTVRVGDGQHEHAGWRRWVVSVMLWA